MRISAGPRPHDGLRRQRAALLQKLEGLNERDARLPRTPTGTNLLGLVKHAAVIEFARRCFAHVDRLTAIAEGYGGPGRN